MEKQHCGETISFKMRWESRKHHYLSAEIRDESGQVAEMPIQQVNRLNSLYSPTSTMTFMGSVLLESFPVSRRTRYCTEQHRHHK